MANLQEVLKIHNEITTAALNMVEKKGRDYNRSQQQNGGDTLYSLDVSTLLGITKTPTQGILVRIADKIMRLSSLCCNPREKPAVTDESVRDTIEDTINYLVYLWIKYEENKDNDLKQLVTLVEQVSE